MKDRESESNIHHPTVKVEETPLTNLDQNIETIKSFLTSHGALKVVTPTPGFVIKVKDAAGSIKVFINVCAHPDVPIAKDLHSTDSHVVLCKCLTPPLRQRSDVDSTSYTVMDCVVNPKELTACQEEESVKDQVSRLYACNICIYGLFYVL